MRRFTFTPADGVPAPIAPYAQATAAGGLLCVTGQMPIDPATGELVPGGIEAQTACFAVSGLAVGALVEIDLLAAT